MIGSFGLEAAHLPHVLLAAHRVHDRAGAEEEAGLEEGVRHDVEDARRAKAPTPQARNM